MFGFEHESLNQQFNFENFHMGSLGGCINSLQEILDQRQVFTSWYCRNWTEHAFSVTHLLVVYLSLVYTTQVNSTFRMRWLASSEVISQVPVLFTSEQPEENKMAFVAIFHK